MAKKVTRLYSVFHPKNYNLDIVPDIDAMTFTGSVIITGQKVGRPNQRMTFHQSGLTVTDAHITRCDKKGDQEFAVERINHHGSFDEVRLHASKMLYPGSYIVRLEFKGKITRPMNGLYPCFFEHDGQQKQLLATQFESHHAREVFPCIDEPEAKATFDLTLTAPKDAVAIANTPIKQQKIDGKNQVATFETTPIMSTYLLAFITGELGYLESKTKKGVVVRTYATPDNVAFTQFALETAVKTLEFYEEYFEIDYPLTKCDMIALPDFASGAMENWGAITYREQALLVDPKNTSLGTKQYVAMVVAHELAHQWFGNLVTMRWWTDLWLNEGFASWIEYLAVDHLFPEWQMWTQFVVDEQQQALKLDALENTHPVEVTINHPDEIRSIFDAISYSKGSSVIHMLHQYLGAESFRDGLRHYLQRHKYNNTDTVDLWQALEEISGKPVKSFMHAWTSQPGFPVVTATVQGTQISLEQKRYFINPEHTDIPETLWPVALLSDKDVPDQFNTAKVAFTIKDPDSFKLNKGGSGFYRTAYDSAHLNQLGQQIAAGKLTSIDRLGILSDLSETAKAGQSSTADTLAFIDNFAGETDYAVWDVVASVMGSVRSVMGTEELREAMKPYTRKLVASELQRLGWDHKDGDSHFDRLLRPTILAMAAGAEEPEIVDHCKRLFAAIHDIEEVDPDLRAPIKNSTIKRAAEIDPDMRGVVFGTIARLGDKDEFDKLVIMHNQSKLSEERLTLCAAITGFKQPELIKAALDMIKSDNVRMQDVAYWIAYSLMNRYAKTQAWEWVKANWKWLEKNLGTDLSFYRMPIYVARVQSDRAFIKEYVAFFEPKLSPALDRSYKQGLEMLQWQSAWKDRDAVAVANFFKAHQEK